MSPTGRQLLLNLLDTADQQQRQEPAYVDEIVTWVDHTPADGVPSANLPYRRSPIALPGEINRFPSGTLPDGFPSVDPRDDALIVVCTSSDDTASQLRAGEALSAVLLEATAVGLSTMPLTQAVEVARTRDLLRNELLDDIAFPQVLVRVGWPEDGLEPLPFTPRRAIDEVIVTPEHLPARLGPYQPH
jgi:hypothetical protein